MKMTYNILKDEHKNILQNSIIASKKEGREICGFLVDNGYFLSLIEVRNKTKKGGGFSFYYNDVRNLQKAVNLLGHEIIGTFHSHPAGLSVPGDSDIEGALDDSLMLIIDVMDKKSDLWYIKDKKSRKMRIKFI